MNRKMRAALLISIFFLGCTIMVQGNFRGQYRIVKNPNSGQAVDYDQAKYLIITVKNSSKAGTRIKLLLSLVEYFSEEEIDLDRGRIKLKEVIKALKARGKKYMAEFTDPWDGEKAWVWFE